MKKIFWTIIGLLSATYNSYSQTIDWVQTIHYLSTAGAQGVAIDASGNTYVAGHYEASYHSSRGGVFVVKYDPSGNFLWADTSGGTFWAKSAGIVIDKNGNAYTAIWEGNGAITIGSSVYTGSNMMYLIKYNSSGQVQWVKGRTGASEPWAMEIDKYDNIYVTGVDGFGGFIVKCDTNGNLLLNMYTSGGHDIGLDSLLNMYDDCIKKYDNAGTQLWLYSPIEPSRIAVDAGGNSYYTVRGAYLNSGLTKLYSNGKVAWSIPVPYQGAYAIYCDSLFNVYVAGLYGTGMTATGMCLTKYDSLGNIISYFQFPNTTSSYRPTSIIKRRNNIYLTCSESAWLNNGYLYKLTESVTTNVEAAEKFVSETAISIFPNPSSGILTLKGEITQTKIAVHNVLGNCVWNKEYRNESELKIDLSDQPKGIYFVEISGESGRVVRKVVIE